MTFIGKPCCEALKLAFEGANERDGTGLVQNLGQPYHVGIRYKIERGKFGVMLFSVCPWCETDLRKKKRQRPA